MPPETAEITWSWALVGWPWWLVLLLVVVVVSVVRRLVTAELAATPVTTRRWLRGLRTCAAILIGLLLLQPSCTRVTTEQIPPTLHVLLDVSESMAVVDRDLAAELRLDEAVALGLMMPDVRDTSARDLGAAVIAIRDALPVIRQAATMASGPVEARRQSAAIIEPLDEGIASAAEQLADHPELAALVERMHGQLFGLSAALRWDDDSDQPRPTLVDAETMVADLREGVRQIVPQLRTLQQARDDALVATSGADSEIGRAVAALAERSRLDRAYDLLTNHLTEHVGERARVQIQSMNEEMTVLDLGAAPVAPSGLTDPREPLAGLAAQRAQGPVLILSDGRQTAGSDPTPVLHALHAGGRRVGAIGLGDPVQLRDAVVAEIITAEEVILEETITLDVRFRITDSLSSAWDLIIERHGEEVDRRLVRAAPQWQTESFEVSADALGTQRFLARLVPRDVSVAVTEDRGLLREVWTGIDGQTLEVLLRTPGYPDKPIEQGLVASASAPAGWGNNYGQRLRGYVVPPLTGDYQFKLAADDQAQLWIGASADPDGASLVAEVTGHTNPGEFTRESGQVSQELRLRAGEAYYFEVRHKQGSGGDHCSVGWVLPDGTAAAVIAGDYLLPWGTDLAALQPSNASAGEEESAEASLDNNAAQVSVGVHADPVRVLLLDRQPRWDPRYLITLFQRDRRVELDHRFLVVHRERSPDKPFVPDTQDELDAYDVVVLGDLSRAELGGSEAEQRLVDFVSRRGGFLMAVAGPTALPSAYTLGGLADVLPVTSRQGTSDGPTQGAVWSVQATDEGAEHPITAVLDDPTLNRQLWPALPNLTWVAAGIQAKPAARTLLTAHGTGADSVPLVVLHEVGAGRVGFLASDETWRWRDRIGDRVHQRFWLQVLRWGLTGRLRGSDARLQVGLDRTQMDLGASTRLRARARSADGTSLDASIRVAISRLNPIDESEEPIAERELLLVDDARELRALDLNELEAGTYRLRVRAEHPDLDGVVEVRDLVVRDRSGRESLDLSADMGALQRLASAGGGTSATFGGWQAVVDDLVHDAKPHPEHSERTWDIFRAGYLILALLVGVLLAEWVLRKRAGLP